MSLYPARLAVLLGAVLGRKPGGIPPYAPPGLRLLQVHLECRANPTPQQINSVTSTFISCPVLAVLLPLTAYCAHLVCVLLMRWIGPCSGDY
jgi:hypothetical protein